MDAEKRCAGCGLEKCGEFAPGARVTYMTSAGRVDRSFARRGTVAGRSVYDPFTATTWVPVFPRFAQEDTPPLWVRCHDIVDLVEDGGDGTAHRRDR
jgi:hypothetical protein